MNRKGGEGNLYEMNCVQRPERSHCLSGADGTVLDKGRRVNYLRLSLSDGECSEGVGT